MNREQLLLDLYKAQVSRSEHYESQRALISNLIVALTVALVAVATFDKSLSPSDIPLAAMTILLGCFGKVSSLLHYERARRHGKTAEAYRNALDSAVPDAGINKIRATAHQALIDQHGKRSLRLHHLWDGLPWCIIALGLVLLVLALVGVGGAG